MPSVVGVIIVIGCSVTGVSSVIMLSPSPGAASGTAPGLRLAPQRVLNFVEAQRGLFGVNWRHYPVNQLGHDLLQVIGVDP